ncbi:uncharacterized protein LOC128387030 [Panonychus citri]|uniref:uncharacterized protein LOC128387030 n=1 Tax=Panonychus citri TaxID=50023 RepID=UPI002306E0C1|nr:uncharacterized protein LOC128387030 [Panonychus citri]
MKIVLCCLILIISIVANDAIVCTPSYCATVLCKQIGPNDCDPGSVYKPNGGFCGCCPVCIEQLGEGQSCGPSLMIRGGPPPTSECRSPLVCKSFSPNEPRKCTYPYQSPPIIGPTYPTPAQPISDCSSDSNDAIIIIDQF